MEHKTTVTTAQHTKGPWRFKATGGELGRAQVFGPPHADGGDYAALATLANPADARLIAAAPELLRAVRLTECAMQQLPSAIRGILGPEIKICRAAIAKATGAAT